MKDINPNQQGFQGGLMIQCPESTVLTEEQTTRIWRTTLLTWRGEKTKKGSQFLPYEFPRAAITKNHKLGGLNDRNWFFFFLSLETRSLRSRCQQVGSFWGRGCEGKICSRPLSLISKWLPSPVTSGHLPSLCVSASKFPIFIPFCQDTSHIGLGSVPVTSF